MKRLILFRHAKSDWDAPYDSDHGRPLAARGEHAAAAIGRALARSRQVPDLAVTSSARRARTTVEIAAQAGAWDCPIEITDDLYGASPGDAIRLAQGTDAGIDRLLLAGHEPTWSHLAAVLTGGGRFLMKTATALAIDFDTSSWDRVEPGTGAAAWMLNPRLFTDGDFDLA
jgi:phosphohistidine phosphatase